MRRRTRSRGPLQPAAGSRRWARAPPERAGAGPGGDQQDGSRERGGRREGAARDPEPSLDEEPRERPVKEELAELSFEQLQELQNKVGLKLYNQIVNGPKDVGSRKEQKQCNRNSSSPMEMSSKAPVPFLRKVLPVKKRVRRDPRFDDLSGQFKPEIYEKTYAFLSQLRNKEKEVIKKKLHQVKDPDQRTMLKGLLQRMTQQDEAESKKRKQRERLLEFKRKQRERVQQGSRPYFLKKSEQRKLDLAEKYVELKKTGQLERFLGKKRRRNAQKDRSRLPGKKSQ